MLQSLSKQCGRPAPTSPCSLCIDGSSNPVPEKEAHWARNTFLCAVPTCTQYESYAAGISSDDERCGIILSTSSHCNCPALVEDYYQFCPKEYGTFPSEEAARTDPGLLKLHPELGIEPTCEFIEALQFATSGDERACWDARLASPACGCNNYRSIIFGAHTDGARRNALFTCNHIVSIMSLIAAAVVQYDIWSNPKRRKQTYNQLIVTMAMTDSLKSFASLLRRIPVPSSNGLGAFGNDATCKAQGFFIQFGLYVILFFVRLYIAFLFVLCMIAHSNFSRPVFQFSTTLLLRCGPLLMVKGTSRLTPNTVGFI